LCPGSEIRREANHEGVTENTEYTRWGRYEFGDDSPTTFLGGGPDENSTERERGCEQNRGHASTALNNTVLVKQSTYLFGAVKKFVCKSSDSWITPWTSIQIVRVHHATLLGKI
jgi:hypothetical protein